MCQYLKATDSLKLDVTGKPKGGGLRGPQTAAQISHPWSSRDNSMGWLIWDTVSPGPMTLKETQVAKRMKNSDI